VLVGDDALMDEPDPSERGSTAPESAATPGSRPDRGTAPRGSYGDRRPREFIKVVVAGCAISIIWYVWAVSHFAF